MYMSMMQLATWNVVSNHLTHSLNNLVLQLEQSCTEAFEEYFPSRQD